MSILGIHFQNKVLIVKHICIKKTVGIILHDR